MTFREAMDSAGRAYLVRVLSESGGNMSRAASIAGVHRVTIYKLMERFGLQVEHRKYVRQVQTQ